MNIKLLNLAFSLSSLVIAGTALAQSNFTLKPQGRLQIDYTNAKADNANTSYNSSELRRAYIGVSGKITKNLSYNIDIGIDETAKVTPIIAFVDWRKRGNNWRIRAGQFKTPMSLDESTSSRFTSTYERAAFTDAFDIQRRVGVGFIQRGKKHTLSLAALGGFADKQPFTSGRVIAGRVTYTPVKKRKEVVHLGVAVRSRTDNKDKGPLRYTQRPYFHNTRSIISTGRIAESDTTIVAEAAWVKDKLWIAGEYATTKAKCSTCLRNPGFNGYYVEAGMFFGGRKVYKNGKFVRPRVYDQLGKGGKGAFSVVARYDGLDLKDSAVDGGKLNTIVLGADWYPTKNTRIGVNYFNADADLGVNASRLAPEFIALQLGGIKKETVKGFLIRAQYDF